MCRQFGWKLDHWRIQWLDLARRLGLRYFVHAHGNDVILRLREPAWREAYLQYQRADGAINMRRFARDYYLTGRHWQMQRCFLEALLRLPRLTLERTGAALSLRMALGPLLSLLATACRRWLGHFESTPAPSR